jgi:hypothetical protein
MPPSFSLLNDFKTQLGMADLQVRLAVLALTWLELAIYMSPSATAD